MRRRMLELTWVPPIAGMGTRLSRSDVRQYALLSPSEQPK
jgi:hypothetical protein